MKHQIFLSARSRSFQFAWMIFLFSTMLLWTGRADAQTETTLKIDPGSASVPLGETITFDIVLDLADGITYAGGTYTLTYDDSILTVASFSQPNEIFGAVNATTSGSILFNALAIAGVSGEVVLGTVEFTARGNGSSPLNLAFETVYDIDNEGLTAITVENGLVTVGSGNGNASLTGTVNFEGRGSDPDARWSVPIAVALYSTSGGSPIYSFTPTSDQSGSFTLSGIEPGTYQLAVKTDFALQKVETITLASGANSADFGMMLSGDMNGDNAVTALDFSILASTFNLVSGGNGYDARADLNGDNAVTALDFSILASNFNQQGEDTSS